MFLYTEKYTESEYDIQNNNLLYKVHKKHQNAFEQNPIFLIFDFWNKNQKVTKTNILFCYIYKFHNAYFVTFVYFDFFVYFAFTNPWLIALAHVYRYIASCGNAANDGCSGGFVSRALHWAAENGVPTGGRGSSSDTCVPYFASGNSLDHFFAVSPHTPPCPQRCTNNLYPRSIAEDILYVQNRTISEII